MSASLKPTLVPRGLTLGKSKNGVPWTWENLERLAEMRHRRMMWTDIAAAMGVHLNCVERVAALLRRSGVELPRYHANAYSEVEDAELTRRYGRGETREAIGEAMGRSLSSVDKRIYRIGLRRRTALDIERIRHYAGNLLPAAQIASILSSTAREVREVCAKHGIVLHDPRAEKVATTARRCLMCRGKFPSLSPANRICRSCRDSDAWRSPGML